MTQVASTLRVWFFDTGSSTISIVLSYRSMQAGESNLVANFTSIIVSSNDWAHLKAGDSVTSGDFPSFELLGEDPLIGELRIVA